MADNEKNLPIQDPENLENQITESPSEDVSAAPDIPEVADRPAEIESPAEAPDEAAEQVVTEPENEDSQDEEGPAEAEEEPAESADEAVAEPEPEKNEPADEEPAEESDAPPVERLVSRVKRNPNAITVDGDVEIVAKKIDDEIAAAEDESADDGHEPSDEIVTVEPSYDLSDKPDEYGKFEIGVTDEGELFLISPEREDELAEEPEGDSEVDPYEDMEPDDEDVDPEDLVIYEEVIEPIRIEGERLTGDEERIKSYIKHGKDAIKSFENALKTAQRAMEANRDEKETPVLLIGVIKICGKILEIKCNILENLARIKAHDYIKEARVSLHEEIDRYNEQVINYAALTGEQLTRLSTFLPENIASGKSLAVVPELSYVDNYVKLLPDEKLEREEEAATMVITPGVSADELLSEIRVPGGSLAVLIYIRKIKKAIKKLNKERARISKLITENKSSRRRYEGELEGLRKRTPLAEQATDEYKSKVLAIRIKYGKQLSGIKTIKTRNAFARARLNLTVNRMAVEREMLVLKYEYLRTVAKSGSYSQRKAAERVFAEAITSYNQAAEITSRATGIEFEQLPVSLIELTCKGRDISFPVIAYKRRLIEKVGDEVRLIGMTVREDVVPDEQAYNENSAKVLEKHSKIKNTSILSDESAMVDRASAIARVMIDALRESADMVNSVNEFDQFEVKSRRALKYFKRSLKGTQRAITGAFDENGVIIALIENLRVIANIIEVRRLIMSTSMKINRKDIARSQGRALYKYIELYNGRAIDYVSIVGEQFSRITTATSRELLESAENIKVPVITYKDNYIEVFPKDPLKDSLVYEKPRRLRKGDYTPLMMHHYRLTENRAVETTVVNAPFVFDVDVDDSPVVSWWHPIGFWQHLFVWAQPIGAWWRRVCVNAEIWFIDESLLFSKSGVGAKQNKNDKKRAKFERKLKKLNDDHAAKILALETIVHESDRCGEAYQKQLYNINSKYSRKIYKLKLRWMGECSGRSAARLLLERLVLERERLGGINKVILKYRNYGRVTFLPNVLNRYKRKFIDAITDHNKTAAKLSEMVGVQFSQVSTSVADEIIRFGKMIKFPEIVCCREIIETVDGKQRTVGDRWHGYGLYTGTSASAEANGKAPVMSVGAMGYATDMGVPFLKADFDGMTMMGMTPAGVPLIGFSQTGEASIPFTGTPMMLSGSDSSVVLDAGNQGQDTLILGAANVTDPYSGIHLRGVDAGYMEGAEDDTKDIKSGCEVETPLDLEAKLIEERFTRALRARSMTSIDNTLNWWKLWFSEINLRIMRFFILRRRGFLRSLLPPRDAFTEVINGRVDRRDARLLHRIAKVGGIIEIETKRLYSATKTGVRRSQRVFSAWLHKDIQTYNNLVREFNSGRARHSHIELLSFNIPDNISYRTEERPPAPPVFSLRNRVKIDEARDSIRVDRLYQELYDYSWAASTRHAGIFRLIWSILVTRPLMWFFNLIGWRSMVRFIITGVIVNRSKRSYALRWNNEKRHYYIRYEKSRNMKRYNRRTINAVGVANRPIKYQVKSHKNLRKYLSRNFRIDYNMRIRQLVYRALKVEFNAYWIVSLSMAIVTTIAGLFFERGTAFQVWMMIVLAWVTLPITFLVLRIVYDLVMFIVNLFTFITRNIILIRYGARDVERNRYGKILDCFVSEQYRLLLACERFRRRPRTSFAKKMLIAAANDYNKRVSTYSDQLRLPLKPIEITPLMEKLKGGSEAKLREIRRRVNRENRGASRDERERLLDERYELLMSRITEIQNFVYIRELIERVDPHEVGKTISSKELDGLVAEVNQIINGINLDAINNPITATLLQSAMQRLISFIQTDIKPTQQERFELKRDLIRSIDGLDITATERDTFIKNVILIVDNLGGKDSRRIIAILVDDERMI